LYEIQANERALTALKYFYEDAPEYHVIAAGSLLGVAINRESYSFPVGKVQMLNMYPLYFVISLTYDSKISACTSIADIVLFYTGSTCER